MISWPAVIKHDGEDELIYIDSLEVWQNDEEMLLYLFSERDVLIDSQGKVFSLPDVQQHLDDADILGQGTLENMLELARNHAALTGTCCVTKIHAKSYKDVMLLIKSLTD